MDHSAGSRAPEKQRSAAGQRDTGEGKEKRPSRGPLARPAVRILLAVVLLAALVGGGWYGLYYWRTGRFFQSTNDAYVRAEQVSISPKISGSVEQLLVVANQVVHEGDTLLLIDKATYEARVAQDLAQVNAGKANLAHAQAELGRALAQVESAKAQLAAARVREQFSGREVERYRPLAVSGAETKERFDQLTNQHDQDVAQVAINLASVQAAEKSVDSSRTQVLQAQAAIEQAEAQFRQAKIDLESVVIKSPIDGRVADLSARMGQYAQTGQRLMTIVPVQDLYVEANFKETQLGLMRVGQPVAIEVDALPNEKLYGVLVSLSPGTGSQFSLIPPENATGNFTKIVQRVPVRVRFESGPEARKVLVPGLSVEVSVDTRGAKEDLRRQEDEDKQMREKQP